MEKRFNIISILIILSIFIFNNVVIRINGDSMEPTLKDSGIYLINKLDKKYTIGDIVTFNMREGYKTRKLVKRIAAVEGDFVDIIENRGMYEIYVNDEIKYLSLNQGNSQFSNIEVPKNQIYLVGDNVDNSIDSRFFGTIPINFVESKVFTISIPLIFWYIILIGSGLHIITYLYYILIGGGCSGNKR